MNQREKLMAAAIGGLACLFAVGFGVRIIFINPLRDLDRRTTAVRDKLAKIQEERRQSFTAEDRLRAIARRTFAETKEAASAVSSELLTRQIVACGLDESSFSRLPLGPRKLRGASEIGWNVQGEGPLNKITDLIFILNSSQWLHRTDNLSISMGDGAGSVRVHFSYLTLVIDPPMGVTHTNTNTLAGLNSPERRQFDGIVSRDLLRPYIKRTIPATAESPKAPSAKPGSPTGPENYRVVSLSEWQGQPEIHVRDLAAKKTSRFKPGDQVAGGTVVMIDYRSLPDPANPMLQSSSRMILKIDQEYWAIERGATFADKRKLKAEELPPQLAKAGTP